MGKQKHAVSVEPVTWIGMLRAIPRRNAAATVRRLGDGTVCLTVPLQPQRWLKPPFSWAIRPAQPKTVTLDALGTAVWNWCDGQRRVENIVDEFARAQGFSFHEARAAVTGFLRLLVERGALTIEPSPGPA